MNLLLINLFFCSLVPSPAANATSVQQSAVVEPAANEDKKEDKSGERADDSLSGILLGSGAGLVAVGGIGAGVVSYNNHKPKNVPTKKSETYDENDIDK